jgi:Glycosyltransferases involved in cell wall biogenesis
MAGASITIFTASFNRAGLLARLYQSLLCQTRAPLEWIIVDDGSGDDTKAVVEGFVREEKITILYHYQENSGKHRAINKGVEMASGELFFIVDSDDSLPVDSLETIASFYNTFTGEEKPGFAGLSGLKATPQGVVGDYFPLPKDQSFTDMTYRELRGKHRIKGDKAEVYFTCMLKKFPFPFFEGESFLTEAVVWNEIAYRDYPLRWFNRVIYSCEYQPDGLSNRLDQIASKNPQGMALFHNTNQRCRYNKKYFLYENYNYYYYCFLSGKNLWDSFRSDNRKLLAPLGILLGWVKRVEKRNHASIT